MFAPFEVASLAVAVSISQPCGRIAKNTACCALRPSNLALSCGQARKDVRLVAVDAACSGQLVDEMRRLGRAGCALLFLRPIKATLKPVLRGQSDCRYARSLKEYFKECEKSSGQL